MRTSKFRTKRFSGLQLLAAVLVTLLVTVLALFLAAWLTIGPEGLTLLEGMALVNTRFVGEYEKEEVLDSAMSGMISGLGDRWSYYLSPERYQAEQERRANSYVGIGVTVDYSSEEGLTIQAVTEGGPAQEAGLTPGEIITAVDGQSIAGDKRYEATELIQGKENTAVILTLLGTNGESREAEVTRRSIETDPVAYEMLENGTGYIRVENFFRRSADQVKAAVEDLQSQGAKALVFDMRNNGGGYLDELIPMLDSLLPEGPIFRTRSRSGTEKIEESDAECVDLPMAVLVNGDTYSAAEIFAAELQEWGAAVVVGTPTSGKGYSQQLYPLFNGGAVGISTAEYFTGEGKSLVGTGLTLDREYHLSQTDEARRQAGGLPLEEDGQLQAALELLEGREG
ncbi:S41 family peptidase [Pseudoflavonifractor sp. HCP28S3_F10]|uniref:S41 family peptidase n=1 Tax=Pseudoflavonifractor sp. HCP28S3_F10 TaxID=3438947 RepID=UPI003F891236